MGDRLYYRYRYALARAVLALSIRWPNRITTRLLGWAMGHVFLAAAKLDPVMSARVARQLVEKLRARGEVTRG